MDPGGLGIRDPLVFCIPGCCVVPRQRRRPPTIMPTREHSASHSSIECVVRITWAIQKLLARVGTCTCMGFEPRNFTKSERGCLVLVAERKAVYTPLQPNESTGSCFFLGSENDHHSGVRSFLGSENHQNELPALVFWEPRGAQCSPPSPC